MCDLRSADSTHTARALRHLTVCEHQGVDRLRRPPPDFRRARVIDVADRTPRLLRISLQGDELVGVDVPEPAASVRLLLPRHGAGTGLEVPTWNGNEFLYDDSERPPIRTLTPLDVDPTQGRLDVEVVLHGEGALSRWAAARPLDDEVAISGPGRGFTVAGGEVQRLLLVGDESALPAIGQLLAAAPSGLRVDVVAEVADDARPDLPARPGTDVTWCTTVAGDVPGTAMIGAVEGRELDEEVTVWAAGEAAVVQRLRTLLTDRGVPRSRMVVRGYWKHGRAGAGS